MRVVGRKCTFIMQAVAVWGCWQKLACGPCPHTLARALAQAVVRQGTQTTVRQGALDWARPVVPSKPPARPRAPSGACTHTRARR